MTATEIPESLLEETPLEPAAARRPAAGVVTVFSAKGGGGATVVATNLALSLTRSGVRVCLFDLAVAFGDVAVSLQLAPQRSVVDALELGTSPDAVAELVTTHSSGLDCVLAPVDPSGLERLPVAVIARLIATLRERYDVLVVDTPSDLSEHVLEAVDASDLVVFVTSPEIPAIKNSRIGLDLLDLLGHPRERRVLLLNQVDPGLGLTVSDIEEALQCPVVGELPYDREVAYSVNSGVPLIVSNPDHPVAQGIREFGARHVVGGRPLPGPSHRPSLLRRRRRS